MEGVARARMDQALALLRCPHRGNPGQPGSGPNPHPACTGRTSFPKPELRWSPPSLRIGLVAWTFMTLVDAQMAVNRFEGEYFGLLASYGTSVAATGDDHRP